ncbi:MAG: hypothetical protein KatS3mg111_2209 [Pirellulaceae bacterium]|nr:MAG: hypothetical protein KatS3mg111_2209 [Pirellulaceae bacterium]
MTRARRNAWLMLAIFSILCGLGPHIGIAGTSPGQAVAQQSRESRSPRATVSSSSRPSSNLRPTARRGGASGRPGSSIRPASWQEEVIGPSVIEWDDTLDDAEEVTPPEPRNRPIPTHHDHHPVGCEACGATSPCQCHPECYLIDWRRADVYVGVSGFKTPSNYLSTGVNSDGQIDGSFGFQEGINFGSRIPGFCYGEFGGQIGVRFIHTDLEGSTAGTDNRHQAFVTAGLFRRVDYGWQGGLVADYLRDEWFFQAELLQLRGQLSFVSSPCHELGFQFTSSQKTRAIDLTLADGTQVSTRLATLDTYRFFYRLRCGPQARSDAYLYAGWSEDSDGLLGAHLATPLQGSCGLVTAWDYLIPSDQSTSPFTNEGWNLSIALHWTPCRLFGGGRDYYRPLFDVADNGSMFTKRLP